MSEVRKKIILLGKVGVGKTSLFHKFVFNKFSEVYLSSVGVQIEKQVVQVGDTKVILMLWDLAGEIFESNMYESYIRGAHGFIGVFDAQRLGTLDLARQKLEEVKESNPDTKQILIGNKVDMLSPEDIEQIDQQYSVDFFTSAKTGEKVADAFSSIAEKLVQN